MDTKINIWLVCLDNSVEPARISASGIVHKLQCSYQLVPRFTIDAYIPWKDLHTTWRYKFGHTYKIRNSIFVRGFLLFRLLLSGFFVDYCKLFFFFLYHHVVRTLHSHCAVTCRYHQAIHTLYQAIRHGELSGLLCDETAMIEGNNLFIC